MSPSSTEKGRGAATPGPWFVVEASDDQWTIQNRENGAGLCIAQKYGDSNEANARLIAAAPDHALICWAMCVGAGRWEPWGDGRGEFCMNGLRHTTELDEFGCLVVTPSMREAIRRATGESSK